MDLTERQRRCVAAIQDGLPLIPRPYRAVGEGTDLSEGEVLEALAQMTAAGMISRFGIVLRHRLLGYRANAMVVWDIPDQQVSKVGRNFAAFDFVTLCYQRPRRLPEWPYNLFCMIHGRERHGVLDQVRIMAIAHGFPHEILFSHRCFKQRGARYVLGSS